MWRTATFLMLSIAMVAGCDKQRPGEVVNDDVVKPAASNAGNAADSGQSVPKSDDGKTAIEPEPKPDLNAIKARTRDSGREGYTTVLFSGYAIDVPDTWTNEPVFGQMRLAEISLPKEEGDTVAPRLIIFHFAGGGTVEANVQRWEQEFQEDPTGKPSEVVPFTTEWAKITLFDKSGAYKSSKMGEHGEPPLHRNWRVLKSMLEIPNGTYFIHIQGPVNSVSRQRMAFIDVLKSFRPDDK